MPDDFGLKLSQDGFDIKTADITEQIFNSGYAAYKIVLAGTMTLSVPDTGPEVNVSIAHGLGYIPGFLVWGKLSSGDYYLPSSADLTGGETFRAGSTSSLLIAYVLPNSQGAYTAEFPYLIFADPGV